MMQVFVRQGYVFLFVILACMWVHAEEFSDPYKDLCETVNKVGFDVLKQLPKGQNIAFSPYNITKQVALVGSVLVPGQRKAVAEKLSVGEDNFDDVARQLVAMTRANTDEAASWDSKNQKICAGSWVLLPEGIELSELVRISSLFEATTWDYSKENTMQRITQLNGEIEKFTQGKIKSFVEKPDSNAFLLFLSAFYFRQSWKYEFDRVNQKKNFTDHNGQVSQVYMMEYEFDEIKYYCSSPEKKWEVIQVPCKDATVSLLLVVPDHNDSELDIRTFNELIGKLKPKNVKLTMPLFRIEYEMPEPKERLKALGLPDEPVIVEIGGASQPDSKHKSVMDVHEKGMEGADDMLSVVVRMSARPEPERRMLIDKPFYYAVLREGGVCLAMGYIALPDQPQELLDAARSWGGGAE